MLPGRKEMAAATMKKRLMTEELILGRPLDLRSKKLVMIFETNRGDYTAALTERLLRKRYREVEVFDPRRA